MLGFRKTISLLILFALHFHVGVAASKIIHENDEQNFNSNFSDCDCGEYAMCYFDENGDKNCTCIEGYAERKGECSETCSKDDDCGGNGMCQREGNAWFCVCKPNFKGKKCEINELCEKIDSLCRSKGAICEIVNSIPECKCPPGKSLHLPSGTCGGACNMDTCFNGECEEDGMRSFKCICKKGFTGKRCEEKIEKPDNSHLLIIIIILASISLLVSFFGAFYMVCCK